MSIEQEIVNATATGEEIGAIVAKIENAICDDRIEHVFISLLAVATLMMKPTLSIEQLQHVLDDVSRHLLISIDTVSLEEAPSTIKLAN